MCDRVTKHAGVFGWPSFSASERVSLTFSDGTFFQLTITGMNWTLNDLNQCATEQSVVAKRRLMIKLEDYRC